MQLVNVVQCGTLHVDLAPSGVQHLPHIVRGDETVTHHVAVEPDSLAASVHANATSLPVPASHHQAVDRLGERLLVSAGLPTDASRRSRGPSRPIGCSASSGIRS
jgi:gamma-glutamyl-gamma-aminobutyrate hydrolase PuuD